MGCSGESVTMWSTADVEREVNVTPSRVGERVLQFISPINTKRLRSGRGRKKKGRGRAHASWLRGAKGEGARRTIPYLDCIPGEGSIDKGLKRRTSREEKDRNSPIRERGIGNSEKEGGKLRGETYSNPIHLEGRRSRTRKRRGGKVKVGLLRCLTVRMRGKGAVSSVTRCETMRGRKTVE